MVLEDLSMRGVIHNRHLSRSIADSGWSEFRGMLEYKTAWHGSRLIVASRMYPSTRTCSACGQMKAETPLAERVFRCGACGLQIDRDWNAARNLASLVAGGSSETLNACGTEASGWENGLVKLAVTKQESPSS